jgi:prevent-host-death family protein
MNESRVSVGRLKARLSHYLRRAEAGEPVVVTDRGRPVARLVGLEGETALESRLDELVLTGLVRSLRSADAMQLAAARVWAGSTAGAELVTYDERLALAARLEGFRVLPPSPSF